MRARAMSTTGYSQNTCMQQVTSRINLPNEREQATKASLGKRKKRWMKNMEKRWKKRDLFLMGSIQTSSSRLVSSKRTCPFLHEANLQQTAWVGGGQKQEGEDVTIKPSAISLYTLVESRRVQESSAGFAHLWIGQRLWRSQPSRRR